MKLFSVERRTKEKGTNRAEGYTTKRLVDPSLGRQSKYTFSLTDGEVTTLGETQTRVHKVQHRWLLEHGKDGYSDLV